MDREIKFRGRAEGVWHFGDLSHLMYLFFVNDVLVEQETIGQFTGLCDESGREIYEGDIVRVGSMKGYIGWDKRTESFCVRSKYNGKCSTEQLNKAMLSCHIYVIGNIYDNPNLIKEE